MAAHDAHGMTPSVTTLALMPVPQPMNMAQSIQAAKTRGWYGSRSRRRWVYDDRQHPSTRQETSASPGGTFCNSLGPGGGVIFCWRQAWFPGDPNE
ncbi:hypothetical protein Daesc_010001 [Daldinia eschscholtzii]|uniref:Uncharacterized protein n=1 Tax=Daldinia eschscholtzii TaxID=292717 RepID=A0AAX6M780_9PEZI